MTPVQDIGALLRALTARAALWELAAIVACVAGAWLIVKLLRGRREMPPSVWFGEHVVDGVLFPALAAAAVAAVRWVWMGQPVLLSLVLPLLLALLIIRLGVRVLRVAFPASQVVRMLERTLSWIVWIGLVLWLTGLLPLLLDEMESVHWKVGGSKVSLRSLVEGTLSAIAVLVAMLWISAAIETRLLAGSSLPGFTGNLSVRKIAANATRALLLLVGLLLALSAAGIPLAALSVLGGAVGVGIGFGLQKLASNYVSGFVILAERSLRIGDMVKVDNFEGRITDIKTRFTVVRALNGREAIVPNEMLITQRVENLSLADPKVLSSCTLQVAYGSDVETLLPRLREAVAAVPRVLADPGPGVQLDSFGADGMNLVVNFWIADPHNGTGNVRSEVNLALLRTLNELGVEIPFPQRVVQVKPAPELLPAPPGAPVPQAQ